MHRRALFSTAALGLAAGATPAAAQAQPAAPPGWRRFEIVTRVALPDPGEAQLWLPLAQSAGGYQAPLELRWRSSGMGGVSRDERYGAEMLKLRWAAGSTAPKTVELVQTVATCDRAGGNALLPVTSAERRFWSEATESVPTDGIVGETARRIVGDRAEPKAKIRAIYDWVVDNTSRNPDTPGCGFGDIRAMLESGNLSGKCADINGLMTGLARAAGFPARDVYGIRVGPSRHFRTMGATSADISRAQHCRSEVWLDGEGWFPLDPADVRKVILDHRLALDSAEIRDLREKLFGGWEMNWVGYNSATDIALPEAGAQQKPNFAFLMYPCAFTSAGQPDCLNPPQFRYEITSREVVS